MRRFFLFAFSFSLLASTLRAQDVIAPETVEVVKKATVFIRVEGDGWGSSGSGFVVKSHEKAVLIATNDHVAAAKPPAFASSGKTATITVVFDSGTKTERSYTAQILATDPERDLAVLRVAEVKDPPKPIAYSEPPKLVETMQVYSFGFPFGKALSPTKGFPAITVGKASISSLRDGPDGELSVVQIDGNLNPGNSGGPVVDTKGRLVGVAVATIRDGQGIGLAVPSRELDRMMQGRIGRVRVASRKGADGTIIVRVEAELLDPTNNLRSPAAHYFHVAPKAKQPDTTALDKHPGSKKLDLKIEKGLAVAEFNMPAPEGVVLVQVAADAGSGKANVGSRVRSFSLAPPPKPSDLTGKPLPGWKEYSPRDNTFIVWVPEKPEKQTDEQRDSTLGGQRMRVNTVVGKTAEGLVYQAESVLLPLSLAKLTRKDLLDIVRTGLVKELGGKVTDSKEATSGALGGAEYTIEAGSTVTRVRVYTSGSRVYTVQVTGKSEEVASVDAEVILSSYRVPGAAGTVVAKEPGGDTGKLPNPSEPKTIAGGKEPTILGSIARDPKFKTIGPAGAILIGVEVRFAKFGATEITRAVRPIYRVNGKEEFGEQFGNDLIGSVTLKAKEGYAVGGITGKAGPWCNGFSLTFMKVKSDGTLDPKESYESDWAGFNGKSEVIRVVSDGSPVVGIVGKIVGSETTAFGLLYKGQEGFDPKATTGDATIPAPAKGQDPAILGHPSAPTFKDVAPANGYLIGLEIGLGKFGPNDVVYAVRSIFKVGDKEVMGEQRGTNLTRVMTVKAKDGYAVGAITLKAGLGLDGLSITFMKVVDGKLDPKDAYESDWIGGKGGRPPVKFGGDGTLVVGIIGRTNAKDANGLGILLKGQEEFEPKKK